MFKCGVNISKLAEHGAVAHLPDSLSCIKFPEPELLSVEPPEFLAFPFSFAVDDWLEELKMEPAPAAAVLTAALDPPVKTLEVL